MNKAMKIVIVVVLIAVVGTVIAVKQQGKNENSETAAAANSNVGTTTESTLQNLGNSRDGENTINLPRLLDLGATQCIPCKMMAPILEGLKKEYKGRLEVVFIDVWEKPEETKKYGIKLIPTQIFYDASGKELFRHEGFFSKEDIIKKWKEFGIKL